MRNFLILFLVISFISCKTQPSLELTEFTVNVKDSAQIVLSELAENVTYTRLETTPDILLGNLRKIVRKGDNIFTQANRGEVRRFSMDGRFLNSIGSIGKGPGEYSGVVDIAVDEECLYVLSGNNTVVKYRFDGEYIDTYSLDKIGKIEQEKEGLSGILVNSFYWFKNEFYFNAGEIFVPDGKGGYNNYTKMIKTDEAFNLKDSTTLLEYHLPQMALDVYSNVVYFFTYNDKLYFWPSSISSQTFITSEVFSYENEKIERKLTFNFEGYEKREDGQPNLTVSALSFTDRYYIANYDDNIFYYDVLTHKKQSAAGGFEDDFFNTGKVKIRPLENNTYYFIKNGYELVDIIEGVEEESNPVIFWVELKKGEN